MTDEAKPLFSIIIPAYNAAEYLEETIESLKAQTDFGFELIVVDDGSTDSTPAILKDFSHQEHPFRVSIVQQENKGRLLARREGLARASGQYAVFLDSDDMLKQDTIEVLRSEVMRTHADIIIFGMSHFPDFSQPIFSKGLPFGLYEGKDYQTAKQSFARGESNMLCGKAIKLDSFDLPRDYTPYAWLIHGEDLFQLLPAVDQSISCSHINEALYYYRKHQNATTAFFKPEQLDSIGIVCKRLLDYGNKWGISADAVCGSLRNIIWTSKILANDRKARPVMSHELDRFRMLIESLHLDGYISHSGLRFDERLYINSVLSVNVPMVIFLNYLGRFLKKLIKHPLQS